MVAQMRSERKRGAKDERKVISLSNWADGIAIN